MKRCAIWLLITALLLSGCSSAQQTDPYRVDTVVQIPVDPTDAPTEAPTEPVTEPPTEEPTEAPTEAPTEVPAEPKKTTTSSKGSSSGKSGSGGKKTNSGKTQTQATEPPVTQPVALPESPFDPSSYGVGDLEHAILNELNVSRMEAGVPELSINGRLSGIAYLRAMEASVSWSHMRPDGRDYTSALSDYGYEYGIVVELMVYAPGNGDPAIIAGKWMSAKSHSENILSGDFSAAGIGVYSADGMTYVACLLVG